MEYIMGAMLLWFMALVTWNIIEHFSGSAN